MIVDMIWPRNILPPRTVMIELANATMGGGRTLTAVDQFVKTDAGWWKLTLGDIPFASSQQKLQWRAVAAQLGGRVGKIAVPIYDPNTPWPTINGKVVKSYGSIPHSDGTFFSDGTGYSQDVIIAEVIVDAAMGDISLTMDVLVGGALQPGMSFDVAYRLYRIKSIQTITPNGGGSVTYQLKVTPPLREDIPAGSFANFDDPMLGCRLNTDGEMESGVDDYAGRTLAKIDFVEVLP